MDHAKITKTIVTGFLTLIFCVALVFTAVSLSGSRKTGSAKEDTLARSYGAAVAFTPEAIVDKRDSLESGKQISAVANFPPTANVLAWQADYCGSGLATRFSWDYSDPENDPQAYYQVQIDDSSDFSSPAEDSGKVASTTDSFAVVATKLAYHAAYRWRLKVWDNFGNDSGWISGSDFSTPLHSYPKVDFSWEPAAPKAQQQITFTDGSRVCNGAAVASRLWALGGAVPSTGSDAVMIVKYAAKNDYTAKLTITDSSGYSCSQEKDIKVRPNVLDWDER